jgi:UDP-N-acetylglucosamine 2-epimerase (non-hydrolysing)
VKVLTILGTRPEIIRLRAVIDVLDTTCEHVLVHTGQNFDQRLSQLFFDEMELREPDIHLGVRGEGFADQVGQIVARAGRLFAEQKPDALLVLGDTNSGLTAFVAKRMQIPVYHMEAGNRCYDDTVPEEVNRRVIDHSSSVLMPYTHRSASNLTREGVEGERIVVTGNPIIEVLRRFEAQIAATDVLARLGLHRQGYFLATAHRAETTDVESRLRSLSSSLEQAGERYAMPVVCSLHPRTADKMRSFGISADRVRFVPPLGFFDFVRLEQEAFCVLSDSGTVQEECCIFGVPTVTLRDVTERPETIECGSNILSGVEPESVLRCVEIATGRTGGWTPPPEYLVPDVSSVVGDVVLGSAPWADVPRAPGDGTYGPGRPGAGEPVGLRGAS